ncbi:hypothetical protein Tco_1106865 [Tanacetum coccineum]
MSVNLLARSSRKDKSLVVQAQENTLANQPQDLEDTYAQQCPNAGWFTKKSGSGNAKRRTTCLDLLLKQLGVKESFSRQTNIIRSRRIAGLEKLTAQYKERSQWNNGEGDVSKPRSFESHMSKSTKPYPSFYNNDFYYLLNLSTEEKYATSLTKHYGARHIQGIKDMILDRWSKESECEKDINNALLLFIRRTVILNKVEDLQLGMESYQRTLNLTKHKLYFEGIKDNIPYTMFGIEKGVVYLNQHNRRSLMKLNEIKKFCDDTLMRIRENLIDMGNKNNLGRGSSYDDLKSMMVDVPRLLILDFM